MVQSVSKTYQAHTSTNGSLIITSNLFFKLFKTALLIQTAEKCPISSLVPSVTFSSATKKSIRHHFPDMISKGFNSVELDGHSQSFAGSTYAGSVKRHIALWWRAFDMFNKYYLLTYLLTYLLIYLLTCIVRGAPCILLNLPRSLSAVGCNL